jgi:starvation-inducible DNA-binding protein
MQQSISCSRSITVPNFVSMATATPAKAASFSRNCSHPPAVCSNRKSATILKQAHWNVKGPHFIGLHKQFDKIDEAVEACVDLIAERIVQLGGIAEGTARVAAGRSRLEEYPLAIADGSAHVEAVSKALSTFGHEARNSIDQADELGDADTSDLFTEVSRGIDKWLWFVEAHSQAAN